MRKIISLFAAGCIILSMAGCREASKSASSSDGVAAAVGSSVSGTSSSKDSSEEESTIRIESTVSEETKFGWAIVNLSPEEMEDAGFTLGDSCDILFEDGYAINDVPYYNGYYVKNADPVIVAYPGNENISITYNNIGIWDQAGLTEGEAVTITLNTAGKYSDIQEVLGQSYSFDREDYPSAESFCNFRALSGGNLKEDYFYRGASPVDSSRGRAPYTDTLIKDAGIQFIIDLADSEEDMEGYMAQEDFDSPYAASLYENGQIILLDMSVDYQSQAYKEKVAEGFRTILTNEGPFYIHCTEGKDRAGFVCLILEALAGADQEELKDDYMMSYYNYYGVSPEKTPEKYKAIRELYFDAFTEFLSEEDAEKDFTQGAVRYLLEGGMTEEEVTALQQIICR